MKNRKLEICVYSYESAMNAQSAGADRIELCAGLPEGGTTPSYGMIRKVCSDLTIPVHVIIRPRGGDFCYSSEELDIMVHDIICAKDLGASGVVVGVLDRYGNVDLAGMSKLIKASEGMSVTFHRAFDMCADPFVALEEIIALGCDRILTSGQANKASQGTELLCKLVKAANERIIIMPGCGIHSLNIGKLIDETQAQEYHFSARKSKESPMEFRNPQVSMGGTVVVDEFKQDYASPDLIAEVKSIITSK
ncbi:MAG: copper homeostasis protein CutC [Bacteroidales bacterium]